MQLYQVFIESEDGAFGSLRTMWLLNDAAAISLARRALPDLPGIDMWRNGKRIFYARRDIANMKKTG